MTGSRSSLRGLVSPFRPVPLEGVAWALGCLLLVFPLTAMLHHLVFFPEQCMLNAFGPDYDLHTIGHLLARDPSLPWALAACSLFWSVGARWPWLRQSAAPIFFAFLPLTVYLWDIPFTGRVICDRLHDSQPIFGGFHLRSLHLYAWGGVATLVLIGRIAVREQAVPGALALRRRLGALGRRSPTVELPSLGA
jgi:hypothetical protein